jgi:hypothetical protein
MILIILIIIKTRKFITQIVIFLNYITNNNINNIKIKNIFYINNYNKLIQV